MATTPTKEKPFCIVSGTSNRKMYATAEEAAEGAQRLLERVDDTDCFLVVEVKKIVKANGGGNQP